MDIGVKVKVRDEFKDLHVMTVEKYRVASARLYDQAVVELEAGDLVQASEKFWGAAAQTLKSIAQSRGWEHDSHAHFFHIVRRLEDESGDSDISDFFISARALHTNFYEDWMSKARIRAKADDVRRLIERLEGVW